MGFDGKQQVGWHSGSWLLLPVIGKLSTGFFTAWIQERLGPSGLWLVEDNHPRRCPFE